MSCVISSAVCWKWIFSVERKRTGSVRARGSAEGDAPRGPQGQALTVGSRVDDQELLPFQRGHPMRHLGHLHAGRGVSVGLAGRCRGRSLPAPAASARSGRALAGDEWWGVQEDRVPCPCRKPGAAIPPGVTRWPDRCPSAAFSPEASVASGAPEELPACPLPSRALPLPQQKQSCGSELMHIPAYGPQDRLPTQAFPASPSALRLQTDNQTHLGEGWVTHILRGGARGFLRGSYAGTWAGRA